MRNLRSSIQRMLSGQRGLTAFAACVVMLLLGANLMVSNILATDGNGLRSLQVRKDNLSQQNARLRQEIVRLSSLAALETRARSLGFVEGIEILSLDAKTRVAMREP